MYAYIRIVVRTGDTEQEIMFFAKDYYTELVNEIKYISFVRPDGKTVTSYPQNDVKQLHIIN